MAGRIEYVGSVGQRRPRIEKGNHLAFIRQLTCVICGSPSPDPAHLRVGSVLLGKRAVGVGEKPDDRWTAPLCRSHHDEQHGMNEQIFWRSYGIDPWQLCLALWAVSGDLEAGEAIVAEHRKLASRRR